MALPREVGVHVRFTPGLLAVDTFDGAPDDMSRWRSLNPFTMHGHDAVPVPGQPQRGAASVEAVWQGLKIVDGSTAEEMFNQTPHKRPPDRERGAGYSYRDSTFVLGGTELDMVSARLLIYLPTYLHVLEHLVPDDVHARIAEALAAGEIVAFYDWDHNFDLFDDTASYSHSALLTRYYTGRLDSYLDAHRRAALRLGMPATPISLERYDGISSRRNG